MRLATEVGAFNYGLIILVESVIRFSPYMGLVRPPAHPPTPSPDLMGHLVHFGMFTLIGFGCGMAGIYSRATCAITLPSGPRWPRISAVWQSCLRGCFLSGDPSDPGARPAVFGVLDIKPCRLKGCADLVGEGPVFLVAGLLAVVVQGLERLEAGHLG